MSFKNKISSYNYIKPIMRNNKFQNKMNNFSFYKSLLSKKYLPYYDVISDLYQSRKIEKIKEVDKLLKKLTSRGNGPSSAIKLIETKYRNTEPVIGIKQKKIELKLKTFHLSANIHQKLIFDNKNKRYEYKKHDRLQLLRESQIIQAHDLKTAQQKFKDIIVDKYTNEESYIDSEGSVKTNVDAIDFIDYVDESELKPEEPSKMFLKAASPMDYNFVKEYNKFLNEDDFCVENNLVGIYKDKITKFTKDKLISLATDYYENKNIEWNREMGYSPEAIIYICKYFDISMYAFDIMNNNFLKHISNFDHSFGKY